MLEIIEEAARRDGFERVRTVRLDLGRLASVEVEALRFCFDVVVRGTLADGARLEIDRTAGRARCLDCASDIEIEDPLATCPRCNGHHLQVTGGEEMRIRELEVE